jgi:hypothetical protein
MIRISSLSIALVLSLIVAASAQDSRPPPPAKAANPS